MQKGSSSRVQSNKNWEVPLSLTASNWSATARAATAWRCSQFCCSWWWSRFVELL